MNLVRVNFLLVIVAAVLIGLWMTRRVDPPQSGLTPSAQSSLYEPVNHAQCYRVDPNWPKPRPEGVTWGRMSGVTLAPDGTVWIACEGRPIIQHFAADGSYLGGFGGSPVINKPHHLRMDHQGHLWLTDIGNHTVRRFSTDGRILLTLGSEDHPGEGPLQFAAPTDVAITQAGDVFVTDGYLNSRVVRYNLDGKYLANWGKRGTGPGEFSLVHAIAMDSAGRLYVADRNNARIQVFDQEGTFLAQWANIMIPWGMWMTAADELWVCGSSPAAWELNSSGLGVPPPNQMLVKFDTSGRVLQLWTVPLGFDGRERPGELNWVHAIAADGDENLFCTEVRGNRLQKFVPFR